MVNIEPIPYETALYLSFQPEGKIFGFYREINFSLTPDQFCIMVGGEYVDMTTHIDPAIFEESSYEDDMFAESDKIQSALDKYIEGNRL